MMMDALHAILPLKEESIDGLRNWIVVLVDASIPHTLVIV